VRVEKQRGIGGLQRQIGNDSDIMEVDNMPSAPLQDVDIHPLLPFLMGS
jgi:hypothetical protein